MLEAEAPVAALETMGRLSNVVCAATGAVSFGGIADEATTIAANYNNTDPTVCATNGANSWTSAINWALSQGAQVINVSGARTPFFRTAS